MLDAEIDARWRMTAQRFQTSPEQLEKLVASSGQTKEEMLKQWAGDSEKMLKSRLIVENLLKARNIAVTPEEVEAEYAKIADGAGISLEEVKNTMRMRRKRVSYRRYERTKTVCAVV